MKIGYSFATFMRRVLCAMALFLGCGGGETTNPGEVDSGTAEAEAGCPAGTNDCAGTCVDLTTDKANCGACGKACPAALTCTAGSCCPAPTILCGEKCLDPREDDQNCGACGKACTGAEHCAAGTCQRSKIEHVVLIVQENHTFDNYFGRYCTAPAGSNPTCTDGPGCCEAAPAKEPKGASPILLDDASNFAKDRNHDQACEIQQINGGKMDGFVTGSTGSSACFGPSCSSPDNWAVADKATVGQYWTYAENGALGDRYFQPIAGGTSANDMYFAVAHWQFTDNDAIPDAIGKGCSDPTGLCLTGKAVRYSGRKTIVDLISEAGGTFAAYLDGYAEAKAASPGCAKAPSYCPYSSCVLHPVACHACVYDASDNPYVYYEQHADKPYIKDYGDLKLDLVGAKLPSFSYIKARSYRNEHPNVSKISDGIAFVKAVIDDVQVSSYAKNTLILLTWDEGGGFFDHVSPPAAIDTDGAGKPVPYGTRVPMIAIGPFAKKGKVSHVTMEHSSIVRFLEYNFVGPVGQLKANDAKVQNLGSLLDPAATGVRIPD